MRESNESDAYPFDLEKSERELWFSQLISGIKKAPANTVPKAATTFVFIFIFALFYFKLIR